MLTITRTVLDEILAHARRESPIEACGYLAASEGVVRRAFALTNVDRSAEHFTLAPEEQFAAIRQMRAAKLTLRAAYHSHPATPARPSDEDIRLAQDPNVSYVIVSLASAAGDIRAFAIRSGQVTAEPITVVEE